MPTTGSRRASSSGASRPCAPCPTPSRACPRSSSSTPTGELLGVQRDPDLAAADARTRLRSFLNRPRWTEVYCLYRRDALLASPGFQPEYGADVLLTWWFLLRSPLVVLDEPLVEYRTYPVKTADATAESLNPAATRRRWLMTRLWLSLWRQRRGARRRPAGDPHGSPRAGPLPVAPPVAQAHRLGLLPRCGGPRPAMLPRSAAWLGCGEAPQRPRRGEEHDVKTVILAGGRGTRLAEETHAVPKPMVRIGERPILWHIMQHYAAHGYADFVVALGYKGYVIKEYFANQLMHYCDMSVDLSTGSVEYLSAQRGGLEGHPHRHRRGLHDRRPDQAPVAPPRRAVPADLRRRPLRRTDRRGRRPPRGGRRAGDGHGGAPAAALRLARPGRRHGRATSARSRTTPTTGSTAATSSSSPRCST